MIVYLQMLETSEEQSMLKYKEEPGVTEVVIPEGVTSIGNRAFEMCRSLTSVTIQEGVTSIGYRAFYLCENLTSIELPKSVVTIKTEAFAGCTRLDVLTIKGDITTIEDCVFQDCLIKHVSVPTAFLSIDYKKLEESGILPSLCASGIQISDKKLKNAAIRYLKKHQDVFRTIISADSDPIDFIINYYKCNKIDYTYEDVDGLLNDIRFYAEEHFEASVSRS